MQEWHGINEVSSYSMVHYMLTELALRLATLLQRYGEDPDLEIAVRQFQRVERRHKQLLKEIATADELIRVLAQALDRAHGAPALERV